MATKTYKTCDLCDRKIDDGLGIIGHLKGEIEEVDMCSGCTKIIERALRLGFFSGNKPIEIEVEHDWPPVFLSEQIDGY